MSLVDGRLEEFAEEGLFESMGLLCLESGEGWGKVEALLREAEDGEWEEGEDGLGRDCGFLLDGVRLGELLEVFVVQFALLHVSDYKFIIGGAVVVIWRCCISGVLVIVL